MRRLMQNAAQRQIQTLLSAAFSFLSVICGLLQRATPPDLQRHENRWRQKMKQVIISLILISSARGRPDFHSVCREIGQNIKVAVIASAFVAFPTSIVTPFVAFAAEEIAVPATVKIEQPKVVLNEYIRSTSTGIEYYDYKIGEGPAAKFGDKVAYNYKGRLAGRQGWIFDDTFREGSEPVRMVLGTTDCIAGLEIGLAGDEGPMPAMKKGGKRRLVIPSKLGYKTKEQLPIPRDFGERQRLYSTVLNSVRGDRERAALGDSLTGIVVLDVELVKVYPPAPK